MSKIVRLAAVSYALPPHDHRANGVNLKALREVVLRVAKDKPDFICFPEICACSGGDFRKLAKTAPELEPFAAEVGKIAKEVNAALVVPFLEQHMGLAFLWRAVGKDFRSSISSKSSSWRLCATIWHGQQRCVRRTFGRIRRSKTEFRGNLASGGMNLRID